MPFFWLLETGKISREKTKIIDILTVFAAHSLTMAQKLYDAQIPAMLLELCAENIELESEVLKCLNEMAKHGNNLARKVFETENLRNGL